MSGETTITVIGNLTSDPELRHSPGGAAVANFTIASTPRTFDPASKEWKDGDTLFLRASIWREAAENAAASLAKGSRVVASGVLKPRTYETKAGEKRTVLELEVEEIGLSLRYTAATPAARPSKAEPALKDAGPNGAHPADTFTISPRQYADDDAWFGLRANPGGVIAPPVITETPVYKND
ncbi:single-stranded DNA-binding protein [Arthrobacter sp. OAP107]|uniref:single-stranded DNA-binding protein n=1 Tax=Arthrobacter sp. OAP107 TaxID=3156445 RepID=UPI00339B94FB